MEGWGLYSRLFNLDRSMEMAKRPPLRQEHPYYMHDCIQDQPEAIAKILDSQGAAAEELAGLASGARRVHVCGIGTSWHAALVGEHLLRSVGLAEARAWHSFEFASYPPPLSGDDLVIVMAHSGTKHYSGEALDLAKESGASTALVTCLTSEAKLDQADVVLRTTYRDRSSAFTISHMGAMTGLALAASKVAGGEALGEELKSLPDAVASALKTEPDVKSMVAKVRDYEWYCFAGWGPNASTAYEAALKINEAAYDVTTAFQLEQFLHGPYVATDQRCVVTLVAPPGPGYGRAVEIGKAVKATGGGLAALVQEGDGEMSSVADAMVTLPRVSEALSPIVYLVPLQLFTYWLALDRGRNPDTFRLDDQSHLAAREHYSL